MHVQCPFSLSSDHKYDWQPLPYPVDPYKQRIAQNKRARAGSLARVEKQVITVHTYIHTYPCSADHERD